MSTKRRGTDPVVVNVVAKRLLFEMARTNTSTRELAETVQVDPSTISRWRTGTTEMTVSQLSKVANALGFDPREVFRPTVTPDGMVVAAGTASSYPEAFAAGMAASNRFVNWGDVDLDDPAWDVGLDWDKQTGPTAVHVAGYTITTGPVS